MKTNRLTHLALVATLVAGLAVTAGCGNNSTSTVTGPGNGGGSNGAPALPSTSTMKFQIDLFGVQPPVADPQSIQSGKPSANMVQAAQVAGDHTNFITAYVQALYAQFLVYDALEEPIGAFAAAIHSVPQAQQDGSYLWTYIFVDNTIEYSVFLYGTPQTDRVMWRLEVSSNDPALPLDHFKWFDGETMNDESSGFWQFYESADTTSEQQTARIDWSHGATDSLSVSINGASQPDVGNLLVFSQSATQGSVTYTDASAATTSSILWFVDGSGSITAPDYNSGAKACWDTNQVNTVCP